MKAVQINGYSKRIHTLLRDIPRPQISDSEVLIEVKAAAVNPLEILILTGSVKLIQDYTMPLTLGNECSGIVAEVGSKVTGFQKGRSRLYPPATEYHDDATLRELSHRLPAPEFHQWMMKKGLMDENGILTPLAGDGSIFL